MFKRSKICSAALAALGGTLLVTSLPVLAQGEQRVEITGSAIKRVQAEGALPVFTLQSADIDRTGAASVTDLIRLLPSMQGFTTTSDSVNGGGGGTTTANLRNLGDQYTLVLLNGRRVAPFTTGSTVNLEQLPLAAIERVEVLLDGASALYGSDAIGGVVNFITKKSTRDGEVDVRFSSPQRDGGRGLSGSVSKGFGDYDNDGFNIFGVLNYDKQNRILANEREWSKSGIIPFTDSTGRDLLFYQTSINGNPPNVTVRFPGGSRTFAPTLINTGSCGSNPATFKVGDTCRFDFASTVDLLPESERISGFVSGELKLPAQFRAFGEILASESTVKAGFAPPAQGLALPLTSSLYATHVIPALGTLGIDPTTVTSASVNLRLQDAGQRANEYTYNGSHAVLGVDGEIGSWFVGASAVFSRTTFEDKNVGGYSSENVLNDLIASGSYDYFAQDTAESRAAVAPAVLKIIGDKSTSTLNTFSVNGSGPVFKIDNRDALLGVGTEYRIQKYKDEPHPIYQGPNVLQPDYDDFPVGASQGALPFESERTSYAFYGELVMPVMKNLEATLSARYDSYSDVDNSFNFDADGSLLAPAKQGNSESKTTYKLALRYQPTESLLLRASYGTGFRAPSMADITSPLAPFGVIGVQRPCPVGPGDPLYVGCDGYPPAVQWNLQTGGNPYSGSSGLEPETSKQWAVGFRFEPSRSVTIGIDLWSVEITDAITSVNEEAAFTEFERYRGLFSVTTDAATGLPILTLNQVPVNAAERVTTGVDWDWTLRNNLGFGNLTTQFTGTYLIEQYVDFGFGAGKQSSIGKLGPESQVAARVLSRLSFTLDTGPFSNSLTWSYRPGYTDQAYTASSGTVALRNPDGSRGAFIDYQGFQVPSSNLFDWQGVYSFNESLRFTAGIFNLFDRKPALSIKTTGGNMVGVDPRYSDVVGRSYYLQANYKF